MAAEDVVATGADPSELEGGRLLQEIFTSPLNLLLLGLYIFLLYKIVRGGVPVATTTTMSRPRCPASSRVTSPLPN
uniref:Truncated membrane-associated progesterone binding protein variant n=1 Tax=Rattus norvegicus TaxID=10116 RepID=Q8K484_RAT|nr:truncated membrane-associated progesterone binding protein variant [Rattus norvegicus]